jgi:hypothetical protein
MDKVRLLLVLITIGAAITPLIGEVVVYRNNLLGLFIPPQITNGPFSSLTGGATDTNGGNPSQGQLGPPQYVNSTVDPASRSALITFNFTNPFNYDLTLNSMSADVQDHQDSFPLGHVSLTSPVSLVAGQTSLLAVNFTWTQDAMNHISAAHPGAKTVDVDLIGLQIDFGGINFQLNNNPITVPNVPIP